MNLTQAKKYGMAIIDGLSQGIQNSYYQMQAYRNMQDTLDLIHMLRETHEPHIYEVPCIDEEPHTLESENNNPISTYRHYSSPFTVSMHPRTLHAGQKASPEKLDSAKALGYQLKEGQTWVKSFVKGDKSTRD